MARTAGLMLVDARRAAGLSQAELAERAGVQRSALSMYETGAREPGVDTFFKLLTATGAAIEAERVGARIDCWRNSAIFSSLTSVLEAVPVKSAGPLRFPAEVWRRHGCTSPSGSSRCM